MTDLLGNLLNKTLQIAQSLKAYKVIVDIIPILGYPSIDSIKMMHSE